MNITTIEEKKNNEILKYRIDLLQIGDFITCVVNFKRRTSHKTSYEIVEITHDKVIIKYNIFKGTINKSSLSLSDGVIICNYENIESWDV